MSRNRFGHGQTPTGNPNRHKRFPSQQPAKPRLEVNDQVSAEEHRAQIADQLRRERVAAGTERTDPA
jgi:hypothetical protein